MYGALESVAVLWRLRSYRDIIIIIIINMRLPATVASRCIFNQSINQSVFVRSRTGSKCRRCGQRLSIVDVCVYVMMISGDVGGTETSSESVLAAGPPTITALQRANSRQQHDSHFTALRQLTVYVFSLPCSVCVCVCATICYILSTTSKQASLFAKKNIVTILIQNINNTMAGYQKEILPSSYYITSKPVDRVK